MIVNYPKYIIVESSNDMVLIFPNHIEHAIVANFVKEYLPGSEIVSAGFFRIDEKEVMVFGNSLSLNLQCREEDASLIKKTLRL